jgi:DNA modification methylase
MADYTSTPETNLPDLVAYLHDQPVQLLPTDDLVPASNNARRHSKKQTQQLANSLRAFGFINPILIDDNNCILAGHGRLEAAKLLGLEQVPTLCIEHLSPEAIKAYRIADNRLAELADWDDDILAIELQELQALELDFAITDIGFDVAEIDLRIQGLAPAPDSLDEVTEMDEDTPVISRTGDLWVLGDHKLACNDSRLHASYSPQLLAGQQASMVITDPPYNVRVQGHVSGLGATQHDEFAMASGEMSPDEFIRFLSMVFTLLGQHSLPGSLHYIFMDWRHMDEILAAGKTSYDALINLCIWSKTNGGMGSLYRSRHELVFVFKHGKVPHINNVQLGRYGRYRTNVWNYQGANSFGEGRDEALSMHPTVKPVALLADAILDASHRGDLILDAFGGSGSTLIAAEQVGRAARLIEIEPRYVDVTIRRWEQATGQSAVHSGTGLIFDDMACQRLSSPKRVVSSTTTSGGMTDG